MDTRTLKVTVNGTGFAGIAGEPVFSTPGGAYTEGFDLTLSAPSARKYRYACVSPPW